MGKKKHKRPESESEALDRDEFKANHETELINGCSPEKKKKKKKRKVENDEIEAEKRKSISKPTVSIAVSGSIIDNAQSLELATRVRIFSFIGECFLSSSSFPLFPKRMIWLVHWMSFLFFLLSRCVFPLLKWSDVINLEATYELLSSWLVKLLVRQPYFELTRSPCFSFVSSSFLTQNFLG